MAESLPIEINVTETQRLLQQPDTILLLDCREPDEYALAKIEGSKLIPMGEILSRIDELEPYRDRRIVVHCHHGGRSMRVTQALRSRGFSQVQNMAGGIDAWSCEIDAKVPRY